mgnify:CR=1 FL=1
MSDDHLESNPHKIRGTDQVWWYEEPVGICIAIAERHAAATYYPVEVFRRRIATKEETMTRAWLVLAVALLAGCAA